MNSMLIKFLIILCLLSTGTFAQLQNRSFENWTTDGPTGWSADNSTDWKPVSPTANAYDGNFAADCKVIDVGIDPYVQTIAPFLVAPAADADLKGLGFPFEGRPKALIGYYNFTPVGGDKFEVMVQLQKNDPQNLVAIGKLEISTSTGGGFHKFKVPLSYQIKDPSILPTNMVIIIATNAYTGTEQAHAGTEFIVDDISPIEITKPKGNDVIISGERDTLKWEDGAVSFVDIDYSLDNGTTYTNIVTSCPDSDEYVWDVPKTLLSKYGKLRIRDTQDPGNKYIQSVIFKPWELTRLNDQENGGLEAYTPNEDGWSFTNSNPPMWPQYWWQKPTFDYQFGIDPFLHTRYPYEKPWIDVYDQSSFPDWPLWVDVFGKNQCYHQGFFSDSYNKRAVTDWFGVNKNTRWNGACFGFSVSSLLGFYWTHSFPKTGNFGSNLYSVPFIRDTGYTADYYQTTQFGIKQIQYATAVQYTTVNQLLAQLKTMFRKVNGDGRVLSIYDLKRTSGHAVVPYRLERNGNTSRFTLRIYNPNNPGKTDQFFTIDSASNTWTDPTNTWTTANGRVKGLYLQQESNHYLSTPILSKLNLRKSVALRSLHSDDPQGMIIYNTGKADMTISSITGEEITYRDSTVDSNISDAMPIIPQTGYFSPPIGYYLPKRVYSMHVSNFKDSTSYVFLMTDSTIYNYRRYDADSNETDDLNYSDGVEIENPDASVKNINVQTIIDEKTSEKDFETNNIQISQNDSINVKEIDRRDLLLSDFGTNKSYDLRLRSASDNGEKLFVHTQIQLASNSSHQIEPDWSNLETSPVKILIDNGNNGTIDDSIFISNEVTEVEGRYSSGVPGTFTLYQNYPNPFNPTTTIKYDLPKQSFVTLKVYNILGEEVAALVHGVKQAGSYNVVFNASSLASGVYIYELATDEFISSKKMLIIK